MMNRNFNTALTAVALLAGWLLIGLGTTLVAADAVPPHNPDLTWDGTPDGSHDWTLGPTGARGWMFGRGGQTAEARQILVTAVAQGSPAAGVLQVGDVILGVDDHRFHDDARILFALAITAAETEQGGGRLRLIRWREGEVQTVEIRLAVMGAYSDTAPFYCEKSRRVFERACDAIARRGLQDVSIANDMNGLALLASGKQEYRPALQAYAQKVAALQLDSFQTWNYGYANMFLAEYILATGDRSVFDGMRRIALESAEGQSRVGTWGHRFALPSGGLNGYGCMNMPGLSLTISMVLAREAGVEDPALDRAIAKSAAFLRWYVHKGAPPYGDHEPWPGHEDNGKSAAAAVLFDLLGDREATEFFAKMSAAAYSERERGHTGNYFNVLWALPGVARGGPIATGAYFKEHSWYYDLARGWDGSVAYQGSPVGEEEHNVYTDWDCTGSYLLAYALTPKSLYLTGKRGFCTTPLNRAQADEVVAAGRDYFRVDGQNGYDQRSTKHLLAGLSSWSPTVRSRSAESLQRRNADVVPELIRMLAGTDRDARYGACQALGRLGPAADSAAPQLRALLKDADPWLQSLAAWSLTSLSPAERQASVPELLVMAAQPNPADPRGIAQRYASMALFHPYPGKREPQSLLAESLDGVDRELLYRAMQAVLKNEDPSARNTVAVLYGKLSDADLVALLPAIIQAIEELAPSNEMFADGVRLAGVDLLSRLRIREGMPLCVKVIDPGRWADERRLPTCLGYLARYGAQAKAVVPQLLAARATFSTTKSGKQRDDTLQRINDAIDRIQASTDLPTLIDAQDFKTSR